jgi:hypothetical protein
MPIPDQVRQQLKELMQRQEGAVKLVVSKTAGLLTKHAAGEVLFAETAGDHIFRIVAGEGLVLQYYYSSPGTGTRVATLDLASLKPASLLVLYFDWSPTDIHFAVGEPETDNAVTASGVRSDRRLYPLEGGFVLTAEPGVEVLDIRIDQAPAYHTPAIEIWQTVLKAVEVALGGTSGDARFERVVSNMCLVILTTGFETYLQARFREMQQEGIQPNEDQLARDFANADERSTGGITAVRVTAAGRGITAFQLMTERINFQTYDRAKTAYNRAYGIKFGDIVDSSVLERIQRYIWYRHRIVHVSASELILNNPKVPPEDPVFSTKTLAQQAKDDFSRFVAAIHTATLSGT